MCGVRAPTVASASLVTRIDNRLSYILCTVKYSESYGDRKDRSWIALRAPNAVDVERESRNASAGRDADAGPPGTGSVLIL